MFFLINGPIKLQSLLEYNHHYSINNFQKIQYTQMLTTTCYSIIRLLNVRKKAHTVDERHSLIRRPVSPSLESFLLFNKQMWKVSSSASSSGCKSYICETYRNDQGVFADAKEKHGMRWTTLRGLKKLFMHLAMSNLIQR